MTSDQFYADMAAIDGEGGLCNFAAHADVPDDWYIIIADITGSTKAVAEGRYKDVNIAASCAVVAALNAVDRRRVAYIYGGDGATFLAPPGDAVKIAGALCGAREMSRQVMGLGMHLGLVPVHAVRKEGAEVKLAKIRTSPRMVQASLAGAGITLAEYWVKAPETASDFVPSSLFTDAQLQATAPDFTGFECRWNPVENRSGLMLSVIVAARNMQDEAVYQDVLAAMAKHCGPQEAWRPVRESTLSLSLDPARYAGEAGVRSYDAAAAQKAGKAQSLLYRLKVLGICLLARGAFAFGYNLGSFSGRTYRRTTTAQSDYMKFDNALRFVMDVSPAARDALVAELDRLYKAGRIFYGTHEAGTALMTCMVFDYDQDHMHFIDGADGGYSLAARQLKAQMALARAQAA